MTITATPAICRPSSVTPVFDFIHYDGVADVSNFSQEFRLTSTSAGPCSGLSAIWAARQVGFPRDLYFAPAGTPLQDAARTISIPIQCKSWAVFGDASYRVTRRLSFVWVCDISGLSDTTSG